MSFRGIYVDEDNPGRFRTAYLPHAPWNTSRFPRRSSVPKIEGYDYRNKTYRNDVSFEMASTLIWAISIIGKNPLSSIYNKRN